MNNRACTKVTTLSISPIDHVLGPMKAGIEIIEYGDFEGPLCAQAYHAIDFLLHQFKHHIRFVYRHFPLVEIHPHAELAAEAAEAADAQGKFWPMHRKLFENQRHLKEKDLRRYGADIGLDLERYDSEMADHIYLQRVQDHLASGRDLGVRGSPEFFLNGDVVDVSFGLQNLVDTVERASRHLSSRIPRESAAKHE